MHLHTNRMFAFASIYMSRDSGRIQEGVIYAVGHQVHHSIDPTPAPQPHNAPHRNNPSSQLQRNLRALPATKRQPIPLDPILRIAVLQRPKRLQQSHDRVTSLRKRILLTDTDSGPSIERKESPVRSQGPARRVRRPALWSELQSVRPVDVGTAVHAVDGVHEDCVLGDEDWHLPIRAASPREDGVAEGDAGVCWDGREESESWESFVRYELLG